MRCFIALPLPTEALAVLERAVSLLRSPATATSGATRRAGEPDTGRPGLAWASPAGYHVTLAFLGEIEGASVACVRRALGAAAAEPAFRFSFTGLGAFPPRGRLRVLVARLAPEDACLRLYRLIAAGLEAELRNAGIGRLSAVWPDRRAFSAHVTLARARGLDRGPRGPDWAQSPDAAAIFATAAAGSWTIERCVLYKSELKPSGAVYSELESVSLA